MSNQFPNDAQAICEHQGGDDQTLIIHLLGFIFRGDDREKIRAELSRYLSIVADEENNDVIKCTFTPQMWVMDTAMTVDPIGETTFLVTLTEMDELTGTRDVKDVQDDSYESDALRNAEGAPQWIKDWPGPFYITVEQPETH